MSRVWAMTIPIERTGNPMDAQIQELCNKVVESWLRHATPSGLEQYLHDTLDAVLDDMVAGSATQHVDAAVRAYCETAVAERAANAGLDAALGSTVRDWCAGNLETLIGQMAAKEVERWLLDAVTESVHDQLKDVGRAASPLLLRSAVAAVEQWIALGEIALPEVTPALRARLSQTLSTHFRHGHSAPERAADGTLAEAWKLTQEGHGMKVVAAGLGVSTTDAKRLVRRASERIDELRATLAMYDVERGLDEIRDDGNAH